MNKQITLQEFFKDFKNALMEKTKEQIAPLYSGSKDNDARYSAWMEELKRKPFDAQENAIQALLKLLIQKDKRAGILCGDMGTGKTLMAIALSYVFSKLNRNRFLVLAPPHLVYKWKREIEITLPESRVIVLNGSDSIAKLNKYRNVKSKPTVPTFFIVGRVRLRLGGDWDVAYQRRSVKNLRKAIKVGDKRKDIISELPLNHGGIVTCPRCGEPQLDKRGEYFLSFLPTNYKMKCGSCHEPMWTAISKTSNTPKIARIHKALCTLPTIGKAKANMIINTFGEELVTNSLESNLFQLVNLLDENGKFVFNDKAAKRLERALSKAEFEINNSNYQVSEFIKRYFPKDYFDLALIDEAHEYKSGQSAQGQSMGVVTTRCSKVLLLTGTLLGGYANDIFYLLHRAMPSTMIKNGYTFDSKGSLTAAEQSFQAQYGKIKQIVTFPDDTQSYKTSRATKRNVQIQRYPGFSVNGVFKYILPYTVFVRLEDVKQANILPPYTEHAPIMVDMEPELEDIYQDMNRQLSKAVSSASYAAKKCYIGLILNTMLSSTETAHLDYDVYSPFDKEDLIASVPAIFSDDEPNNKEKALIELCMQEKARGRKVLVYSNLTGVRDLVSRLSKLLENVGLKTAVLRSSVSTTKREDWILDKVDEGIDVLITNPKLVETGLDLLDFPSIVFMQTGYNVYTTMQATRRSWRIGQTKDVNIYYICYKGTAQEICLSLMSEKIKVTQGASGKMPKTGLEALNNSVDDIQTAIAKEILSDENQQTRLFSDEVA